MSKKQVGGTGTHNDLLLQRKSSYLKYSPEDFQRKLKEIAETNKYEEEEKASQYKQRSSFGSVNMRSESELGDIIETQVESIRTS